MQVTIDSYELFKALGDETRMRIFSLLVRTGEEICVCELVDTLEVPQYNISKALKGLASRGLIDQERDGKWIYYRAVPDSLSNAVKNLKKTIVSLEDEILSTDVAEFDRRLSCRENGRCRVGIQKQHLA